MPNAAKELSKLTLKIANSYTSEDRQASTNREDVITPEMVAYALAGMGKHRGAYYLARLKYSLDESVRQALRTEIVNYCIKNQLLVNWINSKPEKALKIIDIAIYDITASTECQSCQGRGHEVINNEIIECPTCKGSGRKQFGRNEKARMAGIFPNAWDESWKSKYPDIIDTLYKWESIFISHVGKRLR